MPQGAPGEVAQLNWPSCWQTQYPWYLSNRTNPLSARTTLKHKWWVAKPCFMSKNQHPGHFSLSYSLSHTSKLWTEKKKELKSTHFHGSFRKDELTVIWKEELNLQLISKINSRLLMNSV